MTLSAGSVGIRIKVDGAGAAQADLSKVQGSIGDLAAGVTRLGHYGAALLALPAALNGTVGAFVRAADSVTVLNNQLKLATGSAETARAAYASLFEIAQRSRTSFTDLGSTYASIARSTGELGISQARLLTVTEAIGNAMAISGGSTQGMQAALVQLGQGFAAGVLRGEELNSVMEQTPRLAKAIADGLGVTIGQLRLMGQEGKLTAEAVLGALESQAGALSGEVQNSVVTVGQAMTVLGNAAVKLAGQLDQVSGGTKAIAGAAQAAAADVGRLGEVMALAQRAGAGLVGQLGAAAAVMAGRSIFTALNVAASSANAGINLLTGGLLGLNENVRVMPLMFERAADALRIVEQRMDDAGRRLAALQELSAKNPKDIYIRSQIGDLEHYIESLNRARQARRALMNLMDGETQTGAETARLGRSGDASMEAAETARLARQAKFASERSKLYAEYASPIEKLNKELDAVRERLGGAIPADIEERIRAKFIKPAQEGVNAYKQLTAELAKSARDIEARASAGDKLSESQRLELARIFRECRTGWIPGANSTGHLAI